MKKILLSTTALLAMTAMAAAADLPARTMAPAPLPVVAPVFTWSGFYAGVNAGYAFSDNNFNRTGTTGFGAVIVGPGGTVPFNIDAEREGFVFGGQIGGNVQFGMFVAGIEADIQYTDLNSRTTINLNPGGLLFPSQTVARSDMEFLGTVRGRIGLAFDRVMVYGTGGLAYGDVSNRVSLTFTPPPGGGAAFTYAGTTNNDDDLAVGYTVGGGVEFAITNNLTIKGEYLYYDLGRQNVLLTGPNPANTVTYRINNDGHIARAGINFKF